MNANGQSHGLLSTLSNLLSSREAARGSWSERALRSAPIRWGPVAAFALLRLRNARVRAMASLGRNPEERETQRRRRHREEKHKEERNREEKKDAWAAPSGLVDRPMGRRDKPSQEVEAVRPAEGLRPCQVVLPGSALRLEVTPG